MDINFYAVTTPLILSIIACELAYCLAQRNGYYQFEDSVANLGTAFINQAVNVPVHWAAFQAYAALHSRSALFSWDDGVLSWLVLFVGIDFLFYWFHRFGHTNPILWAAHAPHHSSEELNYTVGARASVTQRAASFLFYWPMVVLGFPAEKVLPAVALHLIWQLWPHTRAIRRLPAWFEAAFNSPTHHRVHHAINDRYLDKNFAGALILWDKLFGTYAPETEEPRYGVRQPLRSWSPIKANLQYWAELAGRPLTPRGPAPFGKYRVGLGKPLQAYLLFQLGAAVPLMLLITRDDSPLSAVEKTTAAVILGAAAVAWAALMEKKPWARVLEALRLAATAFLGLAFWKSGTGPAPATMFIAAAAVLSAVGLELRVAAAPETLAAAEGRA